PTTPSANDTMTVPNPPRGGVPARQTTPDALSASSAAAREAVLLIAHGSRRSSANDDLVRLRQIVAERGPYSLVEIAYLELVEPTIAAGAERCVRGGAERVLMLPYFLSAGAHVVDDLEVDRRTLAERYPGVEFVLCPPLGLHPLLVEVVLERLAEGRGGRSLGPGRS
ncbi:MAG TPA: CbiX/SirB N-terminal domain-containing protein, partial [Planctomycetaceae bacterium]|nr:CbiX/SirB N-terminal domain-containing protein [Planctomycetaceae bacterium]